MGLLTPDDLKAIANNAITWGLAESRVLLFSNFDPGIRATIMATGQGAEPAADLLKLELTRLNNLTERGDLLALWLDNCGEQFVATSTSRAKFFTTWVEKVKAIPPTAQLSPDAAAQTIANAISASGSTTQAVTSLKDELKGYIGKLAAHAEVLVKAKRLHDILHTLQTGVLPMFRQVAVNGPGYISFAPSALNMVSSASGGVLSEVQTLSDEASIKPLAVNLAAALKQCVVDANSAIDQIRSAIDTAPPDPALVAIRFGDFLRVVATLRKLIKDDMVSLEKEINGRITDMQPGQELALDKLVGALDQLARDSTDPALKSAAALAAQSLTAAWVDLSAIGRGHHDWQQVDSDLWLLELIFDRLSDGKDEGALFDFTWVGILTGLEGLGGAIKPDWATRIDGLATKFAIACPQPPTVPLGSDAAACFTKVVEAIREKFLEVDRSLKTSCENLGKITTTLADL